MKILFINQTFYPDVVSTAQHLSDIAVHCAETGYEVWVLASRRGYAFPYPCYPSNEYYQGVKVVRVWPFALGRRNKFFRILDSLFINLTFLSRLLFLPRFDCVVALTSPPLVAFIAQMVCWLKGCRLVYWVMDMNPDEAIAMGWIREGAFIVRFLRWCQAKVVRNSDRVIVLDEYMKSRLIATQQQQALLPRRTNTYSPDGMEERKFVVVPPWSHDEDLESVQHSDNPFRKKHGLEGKFVVMYSGNHSICHPLDTVLESARLLAAEESVVFMFVGGGARVRDVARFKQENNLKNIIQLDYVQRSEIKFSLSAADLHLVVMGDNMAGIVHPCKIYGILSIGRPFVYIGPEQSHIADLIDKGVKGYSLGHGQPIRLGEIIQEASKLKDNDLANIRQTNQKIAKLFSAKVLVPKTTKIILTAR